VSHAQNLCITCIPPPLRALDGAGVVVTVNSDDPPLFGTTLTEEFLVLSRYWGYDADGLQRIALNAVDVAFLPSDDRARLRAEFLAEFAALREELGLFPT
jgi:adenosine deaminase